MKFVTYILIGLLVVLLGAGAYFYFLIHAPMKAEFTRMNLGMPELTKAKAELKKYQDREAKENAWIAPAMEALQAGLKEELAAGKAEIAAGAGRVIVNISEGSLYLPGSKIFVKGSATLGKLAPLLKAKTLEGREFLVGNATPSVPAEGKGRKRTPAKDGRILAGERSIELVKYLEKNGVSAEGLVAAAYHSALPDRGFRIRDRKTMIVISAPSAAEVPAAAPAKSAAAPAPQSKPAAAAPAVPAAANAPKGAAPQQPAPATAPQPKPIPSQPKGN